MASFCAASESPNVCTLRWLSVARRGQLAPTPTVPAVLPATSAKQSSAAAPSDKSSITTSFPPRILSQTPRRPAFAEICATQRHHARAIFRFVVSPGSGPIRPNPLPLFRNSISHPLNNLRFCRGQFRSRMVYPPGSSPPMPQPTLVVSRHSPTKPGENEKIEKLPPQTQSTLLFSTLLPTGQPVKNPPLYQISRLNSLFSRNNSLLTPCKTYPRVRPAAAPGPPSCNPPTPSWYHSPAKGFNNISAVPALPSLHHVRQRQYI